MKAQARIRDLLCLDHFYFSVEPDRVKELKALTEALSRCRYSEVVSGKESWVGIYPIRTSGVTLSW